MLIVLRQWLSIEEGGGQTAMLCGVAVTFFFFSEEQTEMHNVRKRICLTEDPCSMLSSLFRCESDNLISDAAQSSIT